MYLGVDKGHNLVPKRGRLRADGAGDFSAAEDVLIQSIEEMRRTKNACRPQQRFLVLFLFPARPFNSSAMMREGLAGTLTLARAGSRVKARGVSIWEAAKT